MMRVLSSSAHGHHSSKQHCKDHPPHTHHFKLIETPANTIQAMHGNDVIEACSGERRQRANSLAPLTLTCGWSARAKLASSPLPSLRFSKAGSCNSHQIIFCTLPACSSELTNYELTAPSAGSVLHQNRMSWTILPVLLPAPFDSSIGTRISS